jgi:hypothetical protein
MPKSEPTTAGRHQVQITAIKEHTSTDTGNESVLVVTKVLQSTPENIGKEKPQFFQKTGSFKEQHGGMLANIVQACGKFDALCIAFPGKDVSIIDEGPVAWMAAHLVNCTIMVTDKKNGDFLNWTQVEACGAGNPAMPSAVGQTGPQTSAPAPASAPTAAPTTAAGPPQAAMPPPATAEEAGQEPEVRQEGEDLPF